MVVYVKIEEEKAMIPTHHNSSKILDKETVSSFLPFVEQYNMTHAT